MTTPIPLVILTGFLGSGKSTLLARLIRRPEFADTAVIVNEFGEVGIDHALLARGDEDNVVLLDSGCICCSLTSSLEDTLEALYYRRERGEVPPFSRVVVETTGLADPGPIATALSGGMFVSRQFRLGAIVVTVDAVHGAGQMAAHDEARRQVAMADRIVLTKVDLADAAACDSARDAISAINRFAPVLLGRMGDTGADPVLESVAAGAAALDASRLVASTATRVRAEAPVSGGSEAAAPAHDHDHEHEHSDGHGDDLAHGDGQHHGHLHQHGYVSVAVRIRHPVSWQAYADWVAGLQRMLGERLLRTKGFLRFDDGQVRLVQGVQLLFATPTPVAGPLPDALVGTVVLIAQHEPATRLRALCAPLGGA